jgi:hypothetical protein
MIKYHKEWILSRENEHKTQQIHFQHLLESWAFAQNIGALLHMKDWRVDSQ